MSARKRLTWWKELVAEAVAGRALSGREVEGRPQAGPPSLAVSTMMGTGQLILMAPTALTFWDSNYRSESFIPESWGHPWVQFHLSGLGVQLALRQLKRNGLEIQTACISLIVPHLTCLLLDVSSKFQNAGQQAFHRQGSRVWSLIFSFLYCAEDRSSRPRNPTPRSFQTLLRNKIELRSSGLWDFC